MQTKRQIVLCVDDDPDDQMMVLDVVLETDPTVRVASALNGMEAMSFLNGAKERSELPSLVIMDINMPLMDGKQAFALMKQDKALKQVPVVLFTTSFSEQDVAFAVRHGVELVTKPLNYQELQHTVKRLLGGCALK